MTRRLSLGEWRKRPGNPENPGSRGEGWGDDVDDVLGNSKIVGFDRDALSTGVFLRQIVPPYPLPLLLLLAPFSGRAIQFVLEHVIWSTVHQSYRRFTCAEATAFHAPSFCRRPCSFFDSSVGHREVASAFVSRRG